MPIQGSVLTRWGREPVMALILYNENMNVDPALKRCERVGAVRVMVGRSDGSYYPPRNRGRLQVTLTGRIRPQVTLGALTTAGVLYLVNAELVPS
jgi:hypothetical protein